jgi:serine/threonine-protein kinase
VPAPFDDSDDSAPQTQLVSVVYSGRWRVDGLLGRGGMGNVFRGTDLQTNQPVAIKTLAMQLVDTPDALKRFEREAALCSKLKHAALPGFHAFGWHHGMPYFVMTVVEGQTLRALIDAQTSPSATLVFGLLGQLADVLNYLHDHGVVHRDLKPDNVIVDAKGRLTLIDFGISAQTDVTRLTLPGRLVGTPLYMAPEAIATGQATPASDVYAMGLLAFTLLTGAHPFSNDVRASMLTRQLREVPKPAHLANPGRVSEPVARVLARALEKSPQARFKSALEFVHALRVAHSPPARPPAGSQTVVDDTLEYERPSFEPTEPPPRPKPLRKPR